MRLTDTYQYSIVALLHRRISILDLAKTWVVSFFANLGGMLFFVLVLVGCKHPGIHYPLSSY